MHPDRHEPITCTVCHRAIRERDDLVTTMVMLRVLPFHDRCYHRELEHLQAMSVSSQPINGWFGNLTAVLFLVLGLALLLVAVPLGEWRWWLSPLFTLPLALRMYSYLTIERLIRS